MTTPTTIAGASPAFTDSELVFGLVAPVGTNFDRVVNPLRRILQAFEYELNEVRLSTLFEMFRVGDPTVVCGTREYERLAKRMHDGNVLRQVCRRGDVMALGAARLIAQQRNRDEPVQKRRLHVVRSLKHPDEVRAMRRIYEQGFYLIGVTADEKERRAYLENDLGCTSAEVTELLRRDEHEENNQYFDKDGNNYGQQTRDTFYLADVFVSLDDQAELERFVRLVFGDPHKTPTQDEHAMFMAFTSGLRSGDLSRQVGAVVTSTSGDLIAVGANDVPKAGGGLYWPTPDDQRDYIRGGDSNAERRDEIVDDILKKLKPDGQQLDEWMVEGRHKLKSSNVMDITEYGRAVHAEMEALLSCARSGTSPRGGTLYSTTFPCHNCAKHIVAAGVRRVVYVEPYPKSQAQELFSDSIRLHNQDKKPADERVIFEPFRGVGPKRFYDLFSMTLSWGTKAKRKKDNKTLEWTPKNGNVRVPLLPNTYIEREGLATTELLKLIPSKEGNDVKNL